MCATRFFRTSAANIGPKRFHQNRTVSWLMSIPRSASRSSTLRSESGYRTYIITTRRMTSGELLKYRNGLLIAPRHLREPDAENLPVRLASARIWSDTADGSFAIWRGTFTLVGWETAQRGSCALLASQSAIPG